MSTPTAVDYYYSGISKFIKDPFIYLILFEAMNELWRWNVQHWRLESKDPEINDYEKFATSLWDGIRMYNPQIQELTPLFFDVVGEIWDKFNYYYWVRNRYYTIPPPTEAETPESEESKEVVEGPSSHYSLIPPYYPPSEMADSPITEEKHPITFSEEELEDFIKRSIRK